MKNTSIFKDNNIELIYNYTENILFWIDESKAIEFKVIQQDEFENFINKLFKYFKKYECYKVIEIYEDLERCIWLGKKMHEAKKNIK